MDRKNQSEKVNLCSEDLLKKSLLALPHACRV